MTETVDVFLARCDDVLDDWHGSVDSARWAPDGSHEGGHVVFTPESFAAAVSRLQEQVRRILAAIQPAVRKFIEGVQRLLVTPPAPRPHASVTDYRVRRQLLIRDRRAARKGRRLPRTCPRRYPAATETRRQETYT